MVLYSNGRIPSGVLTTYASGNDSNGYWEFQSTPATWARYQAAKKYAENKFGRTIYIRSGWNIYRPYVIQVGARKRECDKGNCNGAAVPGYSSHGGNWNGRDCLAIDIDNNGLSWAQVWEACRAAGFECGLITQAISGIPGGEPWHVIDFNAFAGFSGGGGSVPLPLPIPGQTQETGSEMYVVTWNGRVFTFGPQQVKYETVYANAQFIANLTSADDKIVALSNEQMTAICESFGVPWRAIEAVMAGNAFTIDGTLQAGKGFFWSFQFEIATRVWQVPLLHSVTNTAIAAADILRYEPAEHADTRKAIKANAVNLTPEQINTLANLIASKVEAGATPDEIAVAVREKFSTDPLK